MSRVRINVELGPETAQKITELAEEAGVTKAEIIRRGIVLLSVYNEQRKNGARHLGFTKDPDALDKEIIGVF